MAGHGVQRQAQAVRHVLHETGLAAAGRSLDEDRHAMFPGLLEQGFFVTQGLIERRCSAHWGHLAIAERRLHGSCDTASRSRPIADSLDCNQASIYAALNRMATRTKHLPGKQQESRHLAGVAYGSTGERP